MPFSFIKAINKALSSATTPGPSGPGSEGVLYIPQGSSITGTSPSDCFVSHPGHSLVCVWGGVPLCRGADGIFYSPNQLGNFLDSASWLVIM